MDNFVDIDSVTGISVGSLAPLLTTAPPRTRAMNSALQCLKHDCVSRETRIFPRVTSSAGANRPILVGLGAFWRLHGRFPEGATALAVISQVTLGYP